LTAGRKRAATGGRPSWPRPPLSLTVLALAAILLTQVSSVCGSGTLLESSVALAEGPSRVYTEQDDAGNWHYVVNGQSTYLIGIGYQPIYRHLSDAERGDLYERDFAILRDAGVNTIIGWDADKGYEQDKFDFVTLNKAHQAGLGVIMPFFLPYTGDYTDPEFRDALRRELTAKVERYKSHPALRMWGIGNEVLNDMSSDQRAAQGRAFGQTILELADAIHLLDPDHPVIYRESGDIFLRGISRALMRGIDRPWFLYGMNLYTIEAEAALDGWPEYGLNKPLFLTEFGPPEGMDYEQRIDAYLNIWWAARDRDGYVLGAAPYAWSTGGPEPVDQFYGLVNEDGEPVDGVFAALREDFLKVPNR
jgi:hypothetical protein